MEMKRAKVQVFIQNYSRSLYTMLPVIPSSFPGQGCVEEAVSRHNIFLTLMVTEKASMTGNWCWQRWRAAHHFCPGEESLVGKLTDPCLCLKQSRTQQPYLLFVPQPSWFCFLRVWSGSARRFLSCMIPAHFLILALISLFRGVYKDIVPLRRLSLWPLPGEGKGRSHKSRMKLEKSFSPSSVLILLTACVPARKKWCRSFDYFSPTCSFWLLGVFA